MEQENLTSQDEQLLSNECPSEDTGTSNAQTEQVNTPEETAQQEQVSFTEYNNILVSQQILSEEQMNELLRTLPHTQNNTPTQDAMPENPFVPDENPPEEETSETIHNTEHPVEPLSENPHEQFMQESTARFQGAEWFEKIAQTNFIVAGVGGIGSNFVYMLARSNPNSIYIYDDDKVEAVNMAGQLFSNDDIGKYKVEALSNTIKKFTDCHSIFAVQEKYTVDSPTMDIMICGFDNMAARRLFYSKWRKHVMYKLTEEEQKECLFIDGRLNAEMCQVFCFTGDNDYAMCLYEDQYLFNDSEVEEGICSYKQTTYCACMIAAFMTNLVINHLTNLCNPIIQRDLPFFTEYDAKLMFLKTRI